MSATRVSAWLQARGIHYGWLVAAVTFLTMLTMAAALGLPGAMLKPLGDEFGWTTEQISSSLALRFALFGLMGPFAAVLMERFGLRRVMFEVEDLEDTIARLRTHGGDVVGEIARYEDVYRLCYFRGPEGILVGLAQMITGQPLDG